MPSCRKISQPRIEGCVSEQDRNERSVVILLSLRPLHCLLNGADLFQQDIKKEQRVFTFSAREHQGSEEFMQKKGLKKAAAKAKHVILSSFSTWRLLTFNS